jgi:predicted ATPase
MNLSVATAYAKKTHRPVFIDGLDAGIHPLSQERLADAIGEFEADGVQIIYTTRSPFCFLRDRTFDLDTGKPVKHYIGDKS